MGPFASSVKPQQKTLSSVCYPLDTCALAATPLQSIPEQTGYHTSALRIYFPLRTLGGLQCHLGMNLLMLGGNLSSPSEEGRGKERE